ncbi:MAG: DNA repair protein RadA, partial [Gammaproteobacteria bacterium]|nr:DNA repair protein RadA [Gammaproteobacteria bacterium]
MAKNKIAFVCTECGADHGQWQGQCAACKAWNTLSQISLGGSGSPATKADFRKQGYTGQSTGVQALADIDLATVPRFSTTVGELDRVLGGGLVP